MNFAALTASLVAAIQFSIIQVGIQARRALCEVGHRLHHTTQTIRVS